MSVEPEINILVDEAYSSLVDEEELKRVATETLLVAGVGYPVELGIVVAGDELVHELNKQYRSVDETTDVLSFALSETIGDIEEVSFTSTTPDGVRHLGEVIISFPQAQRQAAKAHRALRRELSWLLAHGVLHLLGYNHEEPRQERAMRARERNIMARFREAEKIYAVER